MRSDKARSRWARRRTKGRRLQRILKRGVSVEPIGAHVLREATYTAEALKLTIRDGVLTVEPSSLPLGEDW